MTILKTGVAIAIGSLFAGAAFAQSIDSIDQRDLNQQRRIEQGVESGQLTGREASRLQGEEARVQRLESRAESDGVVTPRERARIEQAQNRVGRDIYRESHDAQVSGRNWRAPEHVNSGERRNFNEQRQFERGVRSDRVSRRDFGQTTRSESNVRSMDVRTGGNSPWGRSAQAPGQQTSVQQAGVGNARWQRTSVPQAQNPVSGSTSSATTSATASTSATTSATTRQGGYSGRSAQAPGQQTHLQQTPVQQARVDRAQFQRTYAPQAQNQVSRPVTVATSAGARQGGYSGRHSR